MYFQVSNDYTQKKNQQDKDKSVLDFAQLLRKLYRSNTINLFYDNLFLKTNVEFRL